ncbi:MAG: SDR family NAD(P)-dependent oxidoreductase [Pseudomonadota bacterium]
MKTALITGGGNGIGRELVRLFAKDGYRIVVFSLVQEELDALQAELVQSLPPEQVHLFQADLSQPGAGAHVVETCEEKGLEIDVLVNNAGFALWGECVEQEDGKVSNMMQLNVVAVAELSQLFGRKMKARGHGKILNIGSTLGVSPVPISAVYGATKAFVNSFTVALAVELAPYGVEVCVVEPFLTNTNFLKYSIGNSPTDLSEAEQDENIAKASKMAHAPDRVAREAYDGLMKGKTIIMPGPLIRLFFWVNRVRSQKAVAKVFYKAFGKGFVS